MAANTTLNLLRQQLRDAIEYGEFSKDAQDFLNDHNPEELYAHARRRTSDWSYLIGEDAYVAGMIHAIVQTIHVHK